jgi:D-3-phosphoglycerate dehydrogenase / 2-oxoglutarate reductase
MTGGPLVVCVALELSSERLDVEEKILGPAGVTVLDLRDRPLASVARELARADAVITEGIERLDAGVVGSLERCRVISVYAVGTDGVDVTAATARGIVVANVPDYCTTEVAEHTLALILAVWRKLPCAERIARSGEWGLDGLRPVRRLAGHTVGLIGLGRIAREVAARLHPFGVTVLACDPEVDPATAAGLGVRLCGLDELLRSSNVLSIHVPLTDRTRGLIDAAALAQLPAGAVVVNASRGGVVDEAALLDALRSGHVAAAGLDVLTSEPADPAHPLLSHDNVVCTPHMAYYSEDSLLALRVGAAENVLAVLRGDLPRFVANPEVVRRGQPEASK